MKLQSSFRIPAPVEKVFDLFLDPDVMRASIPGCGRLEKSDDTHYSGQLSNTIAHVKFDASFAAEISSMIRGQEIRAILSGEDRRLASTLRLDAEVLFAEDSGDTVVTYGIDIAMWGKLGRMGEAIFRRRTVEVEKQFVAAFTEYCNGKPVPPPGAVAASAPAAQKQSVSVGRSETAHRSLAARAAPLIKGRRAEPVGAVGASTAGAAPSVFGGGAEATGSSRRKPALIGAGVVAAVLVLFGLKRSLSKGR